jgi:hypothetical protein
VENLKICTTHLLHPRLEHASTAHILKSILFRDNLVNIAGHLTFENLC